MADKIIRSLFNGSFSISNEKLILSSFFFLLFNFQFGYAQNNLNSISISANQGISIKSTYDDQLKGNFYGAEFGYQLNMGNNHSEWVRMLHVKDVNISASYFNLSGASLIGKPASRGLLGSNYGIISSLDLSLFEIGETRLLFSPGVGFTYATQTFYTNNNLIVGSHINVALQAGLKLETPLSTSTRIQAGIHFSHYSNASIKLPNDGLNNIFASLGLVRDIIYNGPASNKTTFGIDNKHSFEFSLGVGRRGLVKTGLFKDPENGKNLFLTDSAAHEKTPSHLYHAAFYAGYNYRLNALLSLKAGTDLIYYPNTFSWSNFFNTYEGRATSYDHFSMGLSLGTDLWLGRLAAMFNYGYYLHFNSFYPIHFYYTVGGKYYLTSRMAFTAKIYSPTGYEAHYANFGLLFTLPKK